MGLQVHVFRRGATYVWRRRMPATSGGKLLQLSLRTNDPLIARHVAMMVSSESYGIFDAMTQNRLSREDARKLLEAAIVRALSQIEVIRMNIPDGPEVDAWRNNLSDDWAMGKAYEIVSHRGAAAAPILDTDRAAMRAEGRTEGEIEKCNTNVGLLVQRFEAPATKGPNAPAYRLMKDTLARDKFSQAEVNHGRRVVFRGQGAAFLVASKGHLSEIDLAAQEALALAGEDGRKKLEKDIGPVSVAPVSPPDEDEPEYDPKLSALVGRLMDQKRRREMTPQMID